MRIRGRLHVSTWAALGVYVVLLAASMIEQFGKTTNDSKTSLVEDPHATLASTFSLWNPLVSLGELQNQAYGFLFPQGPFFLLGAVSHVPPWVTERLWSTLLLVAGCEGGRRVGRAVGLSPWGAWVAGMVYGLNPRVISEVAVRSGEILPGIALPWMVLPIVLTLSGRLGPRRAALFAVAAYLFEGFANGTASIAPLLLPVVLIGWGIRNGRARWSLLGWWLGFTVLASVWWTASLLKLQSYSPPFFDYVEDAKITTSTTGYSASLRGASNWVSYVFTGAYPVWPAGEAFSYTSWLVVASGLLAGVGVIGLVRWPSPWRRPLLLAAVVSMICLTIGHAWSLGSPAYPGVRNLLDGPFALLRNVHKIDPVLRLPLALGTGAALLELIGVVRRVDLPRPRWRRAGGRVAVGLLVALSLAMAQPALALNLRTPGWTSIPSYWHQTADFLAAQPGDPRAWVIPGSSFGIQTWGWTLDEPMSAVASTPWVSRSQVPLVPAETIRALSQLEEFLTTGSGSPYLGTALSRLGLSYIVVRHDLDPTLTEAPAASLVSIALSRSNGVQRVASFGAADFGPEIEVYKVQDAVAPTVSLEPQAGAVTVAGASGDVVNAVGQGLVAPGQAAIVRGDSGWDQPADVVGDAYRLRARNFARVHDAETATLAPDEPGHSARVVLNYPGNPGSVPVVARYSGIDYVDASSSQGYPDELGPVHPESAPYSAVDSDPQTAWRSGYLLKPTGQWLEVHLRAPRTIGTVRITSLISHTDLDEVRSWRVTAGGRSRDVTVDPFTGVASVDMGGVRARTVRITVTKVQDPGSLASIAVSQLRFAGLPAQRTLVVPKVAADPDVNYVFTAQPEVRSCITTLIAPDCQQYRPRLSDETIGIDRTFDVPATGRWEVSGTTIARAQPGSLELLDPIFGTSQVVIHASSTFGSDPTVAPRMLYDGAGTTSWIADPADDHPTLDVTFSQPRTIDRIGVGEPAQPGVAATTAVLRGGGQVRSVDLGGFGSFTPMRVKHLRVTLSNPTRGGSPIGASELYLGPGTLATPIDGGATSGAVCGFGPPVVVDGRTYPTKVDGFLGNVISAGPLALTLCRHDGSDSIRLTAGEHHLQVLSTSQFQPVITELRSTAPRAAPPPVRSSRIVSDEPNRQVVDIGAGAASFLATTRNFNPGWVATLDGKTLPVQQLDGWAQGWKVPAGASGRIVITYAPERSYVTLLVGGLVLAGLLLLAALVLLVRTRPEPASAPTHAAEEVRPPGRTRRLLARSRAARAAAFLVVLALAYVLGGVPAAVGTLCAAALGVSERARAWAVPLAALMLVAAPVVVAARLHTGNPEQQPVGDLLTGAGFALAVVSTVRWRKPSP